MFGINVLWWNVLIKKNYKTFLNIVQTCILNDNVKYDYESYTSALERERIK